MPVDNNKEEITARRAEMLTNKRAGIADGSSRYSGSSAAAVGYVTIDESALGRAVKAALEKDNAKRNPKANVNTENEIEYENSKEVVEAIKAGTIKKAEAINYVAKFNLVKADKIDDLSASAAYAILEKDSEDDETFEQVTAQVQKPSDGGYVKNGDEVKYEDQPTPKGKINEKSLMNHNEPTQADETNKSKPEDYPKPKGSVNPEAMNPVGPSKDSNVNTAKPASEPTPEKVNPMKATADQVKYDDNYVKNGDPVKTEEMKTPDHINTNYLQDTEPLNAGPSKENKNVNKSKPEDAPEKQKSPINPKGMPSSASKEVNADLPPPMGGGMDPMGDEPPMPAPAGGGEKKEHSHPPHLMPLKEIEEAVELLDKVTTLLEGMENPVKKKKMKEKKPDGFGGGSPDKKEPEKSEDKPEAPKEEKKEDKPKEEPKAPPMPAVMGYKVDFVNDEKSPMDSYYVASLSDKALFSISARQVKAKEKAEGEELSLAQFTSKEYANLLTSSLNKMGAKDAFHKVLAGKGLILALDTPAPSAAPIGGAPAPTGQLPDQKFNEPQAKDMNATPQVQDKISKDAPDNTSHVDLILAMLADVGASQEGTTAEQLTDQLSDIFSDESKKRQFLGRLAEKMESRKKEFGDTPSVDSMKQENDALKAAITKIYPKVEALVKENKELKEFKLQAEKNAILKARASKTLEVAKTKAKVGLIEESDINTETMRLASLSNEELAKEVKELENSIKMANKINEKQDCNNIEGKEVKANKNINTLNAIPSQIQPEVVVPTFKWSSGSFQGY